MDDTKLLFDRFDNLLLQLDLKGVEETIDDYISIIELWEGVDISDNEYEKNQSISVPINLGISGQTMGLEFYQYVRNGLISGKQPMYEISCFLLRFESSKKIEINYEKKIEVKNTTSDKEILMAISQVRESSRYDDVKVLINGRPIDQWVDTPYLLHYSVSDGTASLRIKISKSYDFSIKESRILKFNSFSSNHLD